MDDKIEISRKEYNKLIQDSLFLEALRDAGVANWEGYSEACGTDEESEEDIYGE